MAMKKSRKNNTGVGEEFAGVCAALLESQAKKQRNKNKILELLKARPEIDNTIVRTELKISRSSAGRYLDELQSSGLIEQIGEAGRSVSYRLKTTG
jgi:predicted HTH transcriptional regulator